MESTERRDEALTLLTLDASAAPERSDTSGAATTTTR